MACRRLSRQTALQRVGPAPRLRDRRGARRRHLQVREKRSAARPKTRAATFGRWNFTSAADGSLLDLGLGLWRMEIAEAGRHGLARELARGEARAAAEGRKRCLDSRTDRGAGSSRPRPAAAGGMGAGASRRKRAAPPLIEMLHNAGGAGQSSGPMRSGRSICWASASPDLREQGERADPPDAHRRAARRFARRRSARWHPRSRGCRRRDDRGIAEGQRRRSAPAGRHRAGPAGREKRGRRAGQNAFR